MTNTPDVEEKIVSMLDALQNGVAEIGGQIVKYSPDVADAALWVVRIDAINTLVASFVFLFITTFINIRIYRPALRNNCENVGLVVLMTVCTSIWLICVVQIIHAWNWVAIFEPKLAIAKMIVESAIGGK